MFEDDNSFDSLLKLLLKTDQKIGVAACPMGSQHLLFLLAEPTELLSALLCSVLAPSAPLELTYKVVTLGEQETTTQPKAPRGFQLRRKLTPTKTEQPPQCSIPKILQLIVEFDELLAEGKCTRARGTLYLIPPDCTEARLVRRTPLNGLIEAPFRDEYNGLTREKHLISLAPQTGEDELARLSAPRPAWTAFLRGDNPAIRSWYQARLRREGEWTPPQGLIGLNGDEIAEYNFRTKEETQKVTREEIASWLPPAIPDLLTY